MSSETAEKPKIPRTDRGRRTQRKLLDAAAKEARSDELKV